MSVINQHTADQQYKYGLELSRMSGDVQENLRQAIACYENALEFYTAESFPAKWADIQTDLTNAYSELVKDRLDTPSRGRVPVVHPQTTRTTNRLSRPYRFTLTWLIIAILLIPAAVVTTAAYLSRNSPDCVNGTLNIDGATAIQPLVQVVADDYTHDCSGTHIIVGGGASKKGLADVEQGSGLMIGVDAQHSRGVNTSTPISIQIGDSDIFAPPTQSDLIDHQITIVIFEIILNQDISGIHNLTTSQLQSIYTGAYQNWSQVCDQQSCGPDRPITAISRTVSSGSRATFEHYIIKGVATAPGLGLDRTRASRNAVQEVEQTPYSIGYAPLYLASQYTNITIPHIDGNDPHNHNLITQNTYKFWNIEHMYTKGQPTPLAQAFLNYMYGDFAGQQAQKLGYINLIDVPQSVRDSHQLETS